MRFSTVIHGGTRPRPCATRAASPSSSTPRTATGTSSATTSRSSSSATPSSSPTWSTPSSPTRSPTARTPNRHLRLRQPAPRSDAHDHLPLQPLGHPGQTTGTWRARASTPTSGSTRTARACWSSITGCPRQGVRNLTQEQADAIQAKNFNHATQDLYDAIERGEYPEWELQRADHVRRRAPRTGLRPARRHQDLARGPVPAAARWAAWCSTATPRTTSPRSSRPRLAPACWSTAWTSPTTRCCRAAPSPTPTRSATASAPTTCNCRSTAPKRHVATNQRDGQMTYHVDGWAGANPHVNYEPQLARRHRGRLGPPQGVPLPRRRRGRLLPARRDQGRLQAGRRPLPEL